MKTRWLDRTLIRGPHTTLCKTEEQYLRAMQEIGIDDPDKWLNPGQIALVHHFSSNIFGGRICVVCIGDIEGWDPIEVASILVHEAVHIWQAYVEFIEEDNPSNEFEAYSIERVAHNLMEEYTRC